MSNTATLESVRARVLERNQDLSDEVVSVKSILMDPDAPGRMIIRRGDGGKVDNYAFDERIYSQASGVVYGLPGSYIQKLIEGNKPDPNLAALNFNFWVEQSKDREVLLRFQKSGDEKIIRAMKPASWNPIPYEQSIDTLITKFGPDHEVKVTALGDKMVLDFITREIEHKIDRNVHNYGRVNDPIKWGVRVSDSDVGISNLVVSPYIMRLRCTNGATVIENNIAVSISHTTKIAGVPAEVQSMLRQSIEMADGYSNRLCELIEKSHTIKIDVSPETGHPEEALKRLERDMLVTRLQQKYVREAWDVEGESIPDSTLYRLHNAVTRAGTHATELNESQRLHLQGVGGSILVKAENNRYQWN